MTGRASVDTSPALDDIDQPFDPRAAVCDGLFEVAMDLAEHVERHAWANSRGIGSRQDGGLYYRHRLIGCCIAAERHGSTADRHNLERSIRRWLIDGTPRQRYARRLGRESFGE